MSQKVGQYAEAFAGIADLYEHYGGWNSFFRSPYLHIAITFTIASAGYWLHDEWWDVSTRVVGTLLAFTLSGFALMVAMIDAETRSLLGPKGEDGKSPLKELVAIFFHFVFVCTVSLVASVLLNPISETSFLLYISRFMEVSEGLWLVNDILRAFLSGVAYGMFMYTIILPIAVLVSIIKIVDLLYTE